MNEIKPLNNPRIREVSPVRMTLAPGQSIRFQTFWVRSWIRIRIQEFFYTRLQDYGKFSGSHQVALAVIHGSRR